MAGAKSLLAKAKRMEQHKRPGLKAPGGGDKQSAMDLYPLPDLVRLLGTKYPVDRLEGWTPSYDQGEVLEVHAEAALRSLIWIAEKYNWGQAALDDYLAEQTAPQEPEDDEVDEDTADPPDAAPEAPTGGQEADLRERLAKCLDRLKMPQDRLAQHAGVSQASISRFLIGKKMTAANRSKVEIALADLAGY